MKDMLLHLVKYSLLDIPGLCDVVVEVYSNRRESQVGGEGLKTES